MVELPLTFADLALGAEVDVPTLDDPAELARFFMAAGAGLSTRQAVQLSHGTRRSVAVAAGAAGAAGAVLRWRPRPS